MTGREFERLVREQQRTLLVIAQRRLDTHHDAEDIVQEALMSTFAARERIRSETADAYVAVTVRNATRRLWRKSERAQSADRRRAELQIRPELVADPRAADPDARLDVLAALRALKRDEARALVARMLGWSYREIADTFGWSYTKTNRCVTEGRAALRAWLAADVPEAASAAGDHAGESVTGHEREAA